MLHVNSVQFSSSVVSNSLWPLGLQHIRLPCSLLRFMSIELMILSNHFFLCLPLLLLSVFPSFRIFSNESVLSIRWPKYWSFRLSISPSSEYSGLIPYRIDWFDLLSEGLSKAFSNTPIWKHQLFSAQPGEPHGRYEIKRDSIQSW